jgi:hypothetical protein
MSGHGPHADASQPFQKRVAVAIAVYTVILAIANMLTNQARTEAILSSNRAADQWAYYQAKGTKQNLVRLEKNILGRVENGGLHDDDMVRLDKEIARYEKEKEEIKRQSMVLGAAEDENEHKEHFYEYAATLAELGIIIASVALLLTSKKAVAISALASTASLLLIIYTSFAMPHEKVREPPAADITS